MRILIIILILFCFGCSELSDQSSIGLRYQPSSSLLKSGLVWKYYSSGTQVDRQTKTNIIYIKMQLSGQTLFAEQYDAGFQLNYSYELNLNGQFWELENEKSFNYRAYDKIGYIENKIEINKNIAVDWLSNNAIIDKTSVIDERGFRIIDQQTENIDSTSGNKKIKIIKSKRDFIPIVDSQPTDTIIYKTTSTYEEGLGLIKKIRKSNTYTSEMFLDELMTAEEFDQRKKHGTHRVGYIDTLLTIDNHREFKPCDSTSKIADYYNDHKAEIKGGKGKLWALLSEKLNSEIIKRESGYLTYRFVVNCEGKVGWFVTEEADLNYNKIKFRDETRMHLYNILKSEKEWTNLSLRQIPRDAYTYITFKIEDGKIIEILP